MVGDERLGIGFDFFCVVVLSGRRGRSARGVGRATMEI
jgi:hypothetical protein